MEITGFVLAFFIGMLMGLIGAGGSILTSALLIYIFGISPILSVSYTMITVCIISLAGSIQYYKRGLVDLKTGLIVGIPALITVYIMRKFVMPAIPKIIFRYHHFIFTKSLLITLIFAVLMIVISYSMIYSPKQVLEKKEEPVNPLVLYALGIAVAILTGFAGVGGGFIILPALVFFANMDVKKAVGTSLFIITINTTVGFLGDFSTGLSYNWNFLLKYIGITLAGMILSNQFSKKTNGSVLKKIFGLAILIIGCWIIVEELFVKI